MLGILVCIINVHTDKSSSDDGDNVCFFENSKLPEERKYIVKVYSYTHVYIIPGRSVSQNDETTIC